MLITATTATRYDTMMIAWSIIILLLSPVFCTEQKSACEIESTVNRTCIKIIIFTINLTAGWLSGKY